MARPQHGAARLDRGQDAVGDSSRSYRRQEIVDHLIPVAPLHRGVSYMVGDDFHVTLAQRYKQQDAIALDASARVLGGEFAMRQIAARARA